MKLIQTPQAMSVPAPPAFERVKNADQLKRLVQFLSEPILTALVYSYVMLLR